MITLAQFRILLTHTGTDVIWAAAGSAAAQVIADWATLQSVVTLDQGATGGKTTRQVKAILQTQQSAEAIVNSYDVNTPTIQIAAQDLPQPPQKFDVVTSIAGERYVLDVVIPRFDQKGSPTFYFCVAVGK